MTQQRASFMLIIAAVLWSTSGLFIKLLADWDGVAIWGARSAVVTAVFWVWKRPTTWRFTRWEWLAALGYMGTQLFFIFATQIAPAANVIFLQYTSVLYVIPLSYLWLKESIRRADFIAIAIILSGLFLLFGDDLSATGLRGTLLAIASSMCMALMMLMLRRQKAAEPAHSILLGSILGTLIGLPAIVQAPFTITSSAIIVYLGIFQIGLGLALYTQAIKHVTALKATLLVMLEPIFNPIWVFFVLGEVPSQLAMVGAGLVLVGVLYRAFAGQRG